MRTLSISELLPGDVLLHYHGEGGKVAGKLAEKIEEATGSAYTHASIYLGDGLVAEAIIPTVAKGDVTSAIQGADHIAVLRTQHGFKDERPSQLNEFIDKILSINAKYDYSAALAFKKNKTNKDIEIHERLKAYFENGEVLSDDHMRRKYICSGLVASCFAEVGIIQGGAQLIYDPSTVSPIDLTDSTFGWLFGVLRPGDNQSSVEAILPSCARWDDQPSLKWW